MEQRKIIIINCPICSKKINFYKCLTRPFCSQRCKNQDLANWSCQKYTMPQELNYSQTDEYH